MAFSYSYNWSSASPQDAAWVFGSPAGTGLVATGNTARRWCWEDGAPPSVNMGPTSGQGGSPEGYVYIESSSPAAFNDEFTMEFDTTLDASTNDIIVSYYTCQRGTDNDTTCEVQTNENGAGWVTRQTVGGSADPNKVISNNPQIWAIRTLDISEMVSNASTRIRFRLVLPASGTAWNNDYALDTISIVGTSKVAGVIQTHQMMI